MIFRKLFYTAVLVLLFVFPADSSKNVIALNYPVDRTVMDFDLMGVSISVAQDSADVIIVVVNGQEQLRIIPDSKFECFSVHLKYGENRIDIKAEKAGHQAGSIGFSVFRRSDLESAYTKPPDGFQKDFFHSKDRVVCSECHELMPNDADRKPVNLVTFNKAVSSGDRKAVAMASTCYSCHGKITSSYPYVHGPTSVWSCLSCHSSESDPKYGVVKPDTSICFNCHVEQGKDWRAKKYIHGPVNTGKCAICHSPHASYYPFNLFKPVWDLCVTCHEKNASGRHIIAGYVYGDSHPTKGVPDSIRKGKELTCASCHNPHASDSPRLWALSAGSAFALCQKCHQK